MSVAALFASCAAPKYVPLPTVTVPVTKNVNTFGLQNMDDAAKVETQALTCHYEGFDVIYKVESNLLVSFTIANNSNKSLIIDKSKSYVLYDGYSTPLFKDVRSTRSTTFNNVQDAINNVQTNEGGVSMTVPPYSKWELSIAETNVRPIQRIPDFRPTPGIYSLSPMDDQENVEFVIPYTFDYSLAKWETCRNRVFVSTIESTVEDVVINNNYVEPQTLIKNTLPANHQYTVVERTGIPDFTEYDRIYEKNMKKWKRHNSVILFSHILWSVPSIFMSIMIPQSCNLDNNAGCYNDDHRPSTILQYKMYNDNKFVKSSKKSLSEEEWKNFFGLEEKEDE